MTATLVTEIQHALEERLLPDLECLPSLRTGFAWPFLPKVSTSVLKSSSELTRQDGTTFKRERSLRRKHYFLRTSSLDKIKQFPAYLCTKSSLNLWAALAAQDWPVIYLGFNSCLAPFGGIQLFSRFCPSGSTGVVTEYLIMYNEVDRPLGSKIVARVIDRAWPVVFENHLTVAGASPAVLLLNIALQADGI
uniref:Uncharacterized protein n=1 Tax=Timema bartmani TaxID=61472 RepID=A0A7R9EXN8_9NEOP|nr:unnamed protein product [Timema bartmani]